MNSLTGFCTAGCCQAPSSLNLRSLDRANSDGKYIIRHNRPRLSVSALYSAFGVISGRADLDFSRSSGN